MEDSDDEGYVDCFNTLPFAVDRTSSADASAREIHPTASSENLSAGSSDMNPKKRSKSLERLSGVSIRPSLSPGCDLGSTTSLRYPPNDNEFVRRPRIPPRPNEHVLARFEQQKNNLVASRHPRKAARSKYVNFNLPEEENRRGREGEEGSEGARGVGETRQKVTAARTTKIYKAAGTTTLHTGRVEGSPKSNRQRTSGALLRPGKPVQRCKSSAGSCKNPRHHEHTKPRRSAVLPDSTPNPADTSGALKFEPRSRPVIKPRKTSVEDSAHSSPLSNKVGETPHSRTGIVYRNAGEVLPSGINVTPMHLDSTQPPSVGDFNPEPLSLHTPSKVLPRNDKNVQPRRPQPPNRKPPVRPPVPVPRPRKLHTPTTENPDPLEADQYVHMSTIPTALTLDSNNPSLPLARGLTPLSKQGDQPAGIQTNTTKDSDDDEGAYSYVDLVKNIHLMASPHLTPPYPSCGPGSKFKFDRLLVCMDM